MAFSEIELKRIERTVGVLCERRSPPDFRDELSVGYKVSGHDIVIFEHRPRYGKRVGVTDSPVAKIKFVRKAGEWRLLWRRADLKWHSYKPLPSSKEIERLVKEVDEDPYGCFFG